LCGGDHKSIPGLDPSMAIPDISIDVQDINDARPDVIGARRCGRYPARFAV
jgi:hypothetical protein